MSPQNSHVQHLDNIAQQYYPQQQQDDWSDYEELMRCIKKGCKRSVNELLSRGYRVVRPGVLNTPLHLVVERTGWSYIVKRLLERGAKVGFRNVNNDTALHHAFYCEAPDMVINAMVLNYLKETDVNLVNSDGLTFLHIVCARSKLGFVKAFLKRNDVIIDAQIRMDSKTAFAGFTALHFAVENGKLDVAEALLKKNANIYTPDANGTTPVHLACYRRNPEMIDLLLSHDRVYIDSVDKLGTSHFLATCMSLDPQYAKQYLIVAYHRYNVSPITLVNTRLIDCLPFPFPGYTPLHFAAEFGRLETVKMLLTYGAFCCALTTRKETPFMLAERNSHAEVCKVLKEHCANYQAQMANQTTPVAASLDTPSYSSLSASSTETSVENNNCREYSASYTLSTVNSTPQSSERVTPIDLSSASPERVSNYELQAYDMSCMGYSV